MLYATCCIRLLDGTRKATDSAGGPCGRSLVYEITPRPQVLHNSKLLAVADEEGWVCIVDTAAERLPSSLHMDAVCSPKAQWLAHQNTVYDVAWAKVGGA